MLTPSKGPNVVMWTIQSSLILVMLVAVGAAMMYLYFVIVPLMMAYFVIFLMAPILDILEMRPYASPCGAIDPEQTNQYEETYQSKMLCTAGYENEKRAVIVRRMRAKEAAGEIEYGANADDGALAGVELLLMGKVPHGLACLLTLLIVVAILGTCGSIVSASFSKFGTEEQAKFDACILGDGSIAPDQPFTYKGEDYSAESTTHPGGCDELKLTYKLTEAQNNFVDVTLKDMGFLIFHEKWCYPNTESIAVMQETDGDNNWVINTYVYGMYKAQSKQGEYIFHGTNSSTECDPIALFPSNVDGTPMDEFLGTIGSFALVVNDVVLILMLALFILFERPIGKTFDSDSPLVAEMEEMVMSYIGLKFAVSALTGICIAFFMEVCSVKIGMVWGLLSFLLNFIPNVGSMIAMVLPLPFIMLDDELGSWQKWVALIGPCLVQGYVGNVLEPALFGASLNLTEISVLLGLVFFAAIWGLYGAVLSVPFLGGAKIMLHNIDHPMAKGFLDNLRQDSDLDKSKDEKIASFLERKIDLDDYEAKFFEPRDDEVAAAQEELAAEQAAKEAAQSGGSVDGSQEGSLD